MRVITIGRESSNDLIVNDAKVLRHHLQIVQKDNGEVEAVDMGSTNGTMVNGVRIAAPTQLKSGDTVVPWESRLSGRQGLHVITDVER